MRAGINGGEYLLEEGRSISSAMMDVNKSILWIHKGAQLAYPV
jgi:hypothetical protein